MIARLQVKEVAGYDEDIVFLVVPDGSAFSKQVPLVIGTCTLVRVINIIKESEMDQISSPWVTVCLAQLLSQCVVTEETHDKGAAGTDPPGVKEVDKVVEMKGSVHVGPFQAEILEGRISQAPTHNMHVMVVPIRYAEVQSGRACQLLPGLQVLHAYTMLTAGSKQVSIVVWNMTDSTIFLKKGAHVMHVISAMLVPSEEVPSELAEGVQVPKE